jgi:hypothetical protein
MSTPQFKVGDRVQARTTGRVQAGTRGTVQELAYTMPSTYLVLFDGWAEPRLMPERDLELIDDASPSERA